MKRLALLLFLLAVVSCGPRQPLQKTWRIGFSQCAQDSWRVKMNADLLREALLYENLTVEIRSSNGDNHHQIEDVEWFIRSGVDLLIVSPNEEEALSPVVEKAFRRGIPVIVFDRKVLTDSYSAFIGADNREIGAAIGQYVRTLLPGGGKVAEITGLMGSSPAIERHEGFVSTALADGAVSLVTSRDAGWFRDDAYARMREILAEHPDVDVVFAHNDEMASGAYEAARSQSLEKRIKFIGIDALPGRTNGIGMVSDGILEASFVYPTGTDKVLQVAYDILTGHDYPRETILRPTFVDRSNVKLVDMFNESIAEQEKKVEDLHTRMGYFSTAYANQQLVLILSLVLLALLVATLVAVVLTLRARSRMNRQLVLSSRQAEEAAQSKLAFYTNISHDLRTPLTLISGSVEELLSAPPASAPDRELLTLAKRNTDILLRLVGQILDFRKYESGKLEMEGRLADLRELILAWNASFLPILKRKHLGFDFSCGDGRDWTNTVDVDKLEQVYYNLLSNAFKYTPEGESVHVRLSETDGGMALSVSNTGSFIPEGERNSIFDRFYQVGRPSQGTGIGLSVVKAFVSMHGGRVTVDSDRRAGTTFTVWLPVCREVGPEAVLSGPQDLSGADLLDEGTQDASRKTVLVVDDSEDIRAWVGVVLGRSYLVLEASDGEEGLAKAVEYVPDVIIMDVMMPGMDGVECCRRLKQEVQTCHIPVIMLTACATDEKRVESYASGADSYITKPFRSDVLKTRIRNLLQSRELMQRSVGGDADMAASALEEMDRQFLDRVRCFVEENMSSADFDLDALSHHLALSRIQLYRKIKGLTDYSPVEWVRIIRLRKAKELLATTDLSVAEICYETGFSTPSYFTKCYKDHFGLLPNEYRKRLRQ